MDMDTVDIILTYHSSMKPFPTTLVSHCILEGKKTTKYEKNNLYYSSQEPGKMKKKFTPQHKYNRRNNKFHIPRQIS